MTPVRKFIIILSMSVFALSSLGSAATACVQETGSPAKQEAIAENAHDHHGIEQHDIVTQGDELTANNCLCCDDCESMCPASACSLVIVSSQSICHPFGSGASGISLPDLIHSAPTPHPLFRPPIVGS